VSEQNTPSVPQPPQQSTGSAPGASEQVGSAPQPDDAVGVAAPAKKKSRSFLRIVVALVVVAVLAGVGWFLRRDNAENASVGSCFESSVMSAQLTDASDAKTVECTSTAAAYKVVGIVDNKKSEELDPNVNCQPWTTAVAAIWLGEQGKAGKIFCVEDVKH
jgi:hypothetical protein